MKLYTKHLIIALFASIVNTLHSSSAVHEQPIIKTEPATLEHNAITSSKTPPSHAVIAEAQATAPTHTLSSTNAVSRQSQVVQVAQTPISTEQAPTSWLDTLAGHFNTLTTGFGNIKEAVSAHLNPYLDNESETSSVASEPQANNPNELYFGYDQYLNDATPEAQKKAAEIIQPKDTISELASTTPPLILQAADALPGYVTAATDAAKNAAQATGAAAAESINNMYDKASSYVQTAQDLYYNPVDTSAVLIHKRFIGQPNESSKPITPEQAKTELLNTGVQYLANKITTIQNSPGTENSINILDRLNPESKQAIHQAIGVDIEKPIAPQIINKTIQSVTPTIVEALKPSDSSESILTETNKENLGKIADQIVETVNQLFEENKPNLEENNLLNVTKTKTELKTAAIETPEAKAVEDSINNPTDIKSYSNVFKANFTQYLKDLFNLSSEEEKNVNQLTANALDSAKKDPHSWWNERNNYLIYAKFQIWVQNLLTTCCNLIGKERKLVTTVEINKNNDDPSSPQITLMHNSQGKMLPALIKFQGVRYTIIPKNIIDNNDGSYSIETDLYQKTSFSISNTIVSSLIKNTINSLSGTALGDSIGQQGFKQAENEYANDPSKPIGKLQIKYTPGKTLEATTMVINTSIQATEPFREPNRQAIAPTVITNSYSINQAGQTSQLQAKNIQLQPEIGNLFVPKISFNHNLQTDKITNVQLNNDYFGFNQNLSGSFTPDKDGNYTIKAQFAIKPMAPWQKITGLIYDSAIKIIGRSQFAQSYQQKMPDVIQGSLDFLLQANPRAIQEATIIYNPSKKTVTVSILTPMTTGAPTTTSITYNLA